MEGGASKIEVQNLEATFWHLRPRRTRERTVATMLNRLGGIAALERAKQLREAALQAQTQRMTAEKAAIAKAHENAKEHGLVEKTAGESGAAGNLRNKWAKWLATPHGCGVAARLDAEGGAPTVEETKLFSTWTRETRGRFTRLLAGRAAVTRTARCRSRT